MNKICQVKRTVLALFVMTISAVFAGNSATAMETANEYAGKEAISPMIAPAREGGQVSSDCRILALASEANTLNTALNRLGISHTLLSASTPGVFTAAFNNVNLSDYDVIVVGWSGNYTTLRNAANEVTNALIGRKAELEAWLSSGKGIVAFADWLTDHPFGYLPYPSTRAVLHADDVHIVLPFHPVMENLTDSLLSNWGNSYHNYFTYLDPVYEVLSRNNQGWPINVAAQYGPGKIAVSGQDADWHVTYGNRTGSPILIENMVSWACEPSFLVVDIDIKPGSEPNSVNISSHGVIPVAVLTTGDFYAVDVAAGTVRFGPASASPSHSALEDVDGDGDLDLILHFRTEETGIRSGDREAVLTGETVEGLKIQGSDSVRVLESKGKTK